MAQTVAITADKRTGKGKGPARRLRATGRIPAVIYGHGREPESLSVSGAELDKALTGIAAESTIISLSVEGAEVSALIREIQRHPFKQKILHVDFYEIHAGEVLTLEVPIHLKGIPEGVRNQGGILDQVMREIEIEVLPKDIPDRVELDVTALEIGDSLHVSDLTIPNAEIMAEAGATICSVVAPRVEEEPETEAEVDEDMEPEVIGRERDEDGEESESGDDEGED